MQELTTWISGNAEIIIVALGIVVLLQMLLILILFGKAGKLSRRIHEALSGTTGKSLESVLTLHHERVEDSLRSAADLRHRVEKLEEKQKIAIQRMGIVRFNAFPDMGSELSFSVALLDDQQNGVVMTGITGRDEFRSYAKQIEGGKSAHHLSAEENRALQQALSR